MGDRTYVLRRMWPGDFRVRAMGDRMYVLRRMWPGDLEFVPWATECMYVAEGVAQPPLPTPLRDLRHAGLGRRFYSNSCVSCHWRPKVYGSDLAVRV